LYAIQVCKTDEDVEDFKATVYCENAAVDTPEITRADIDRMKRDGYLGAGWAR